jgi:hypothetical protein
MGQFVKKIQITILDGGYGVFNAEEFYDLMKRLTALQVICVKQPWAHLQTESKLRAAKEIGSIIARLRITAIWADMATPVDVETLVNSILGANLTSLITRINTSGPIPPTTPMHLESVLEVTKGTLKHLGIGWHPDGMGSGWNDGEENKKYQDHKSFEGLVSRLLVSLCVELPFIWMAYQTSTSPFPTSTQSISGSL